MSWTRLLSYTALFAVMRPGMTEAVTAAKSYTNPKLTSGEVSVTRVCVMPAEGELNKVGMKGTEGMAKQSETWSTQLQGVVETELKDIGVTITSTGNTTASLRN